MKSRTLWELTEGQRVRYAGAIVAMAVANAFVFAVPLVGKWAIDTLVDSDGAVRANAPRTLAIATAATVGLTALAGIFHFVRVQWAALASEALVQRLRERLYGHLDALPLSWHDTQDTGDSVQRCTSDVETIRMFLSGQVVEIGRAALLLATVLPVMLWLDVKMTLASLVVFPFIIAFAFVFFQRIKQVFLAMDEAEGRMTTVLQENLTGIRVVRAFAAQDDEIEKFGVRNAEFREANRELIHLLGRYWSSSDFLCLVQGGLPLFAGVWLVQQGALTVGELFAFLSFVAIIVWPVRQMGRILSEAGKAVVALGRVREILEVEIETGVSTPRPALAQPRGALVIEGLTFAYGETPVLRDVSFRVAPGETVAFLGPPGCGKSTIVRLLLRFYDYEIGSIRIDGRELRDLSRDEVRSAFGTVLQEPFLYSRTLGANIDLGRDAGTAAMESAADTADLRGTVDGFPDGYDTLVGERGVTLSGGQRQRVAIARALIEDPAVLILDDALSAVDVETEARILDALAARRGAGTTLLISHRLSSVRHADRIILMERGQVVQQGNHRELVAQGGPYARLLRIQDALDEQIEADEGRAVEGTSS